MQNFHILCRIWKSMNIAEHWIATASKTITGQYGSCTILQQVNVQSDQQCKFLGVHTALCGSWNNDSWGCGSKTGEVLEGVKYHWLSAMQTRIRQNRPNVRIPYFRSSKCRTCTVPSPSRRHCTLAIHRSRVRVLAGHNYAMALDTLLTAVYLCNQAV